MDGAPVEPTEAEVMSRTQLLLSVANMGNAVFELVSSAVLGVICDRWGRWPVAVMTQIGQLVDFSVVGLYTKAILTQGFQIETIGASVVAARCVAGVCGNFRVPAMSCMADLSTPETASRNFGLLGAVVGIALIMGPLIAMLLLRLCCDLEKGPKQGATARFRVCRVNFLKNSVFLLLRDRGSSQPRRSRPPFVTFLS